MRRILFVPDHLLAGVSGSLLERRSFRVRSAPRAAEALAVARVWQPHLLVFASEILQEAPEGFCASARALCSEMRLLLITDSVPATATERDEEEKVDAHLIAPFSDSELIHTIGELLGEPVRRTPRLNVELLARIERDENHEPRSLLGNVICLSGTGALVECQGPLEMGESLELQFVLPGSAQRLRLNSKVVNAEELELRYAVVFDADTEDCQQVTIFVDLQTSARAVSPLPKSRHRWTSSEST